MKKRNIFIIALMLFLMGGYSVTYAADQFQLGDVFAGVDSGGNVQWWRGTSILHTLNTGSGTYTTGMATDSAGNLYVTNFNGTVSKFDKNGTLLSSNYLTGGAGSSYESIVVDKAQNFYVGDAGQNQIRKFNSAGTLLDSKTAVIEDRGTDWIDLAADQKTMYYTSEGQKLMTIDMSTGVQGADVTNLLTGGAAFAIRLLGDGTVLVANTADIKRVNLSDGSIMQTYDVAGQNAWFALNLDPDGKTFWSGDFGNDKFYQFDITSGSVIGSAYDTGLGGGHLFGLAVYGEITQGGGGVPSVPIPSVFWLFGSGLVGLVGLRRKFQK